MTTTTTRSTSDKNERSEPTIPSVQLGYVILYVDDVPKALEHYEAAFGLQRRFLHEAKQYGELETGATVLAFADETMATLPEGFVKNRRGSAAPGVEVGFVVPDVQAAFDRAVAAGALAKLSPTTKPWGQIVAYVIDRHGFLVEICTSMAG
jgi:lactoylglutathione lyase